MEPQQKLNLFYLLLVKKFILKKKQIQQLGGLFIAKGMR